MTEPDAGLYQKMLRRNGRLDRSPSKGSIDSPNKKNFSLDDDDKQEAKEATQKILTRCGSTSGNMSLFVD